MSTPLLLTMQIVAFWPAWRWYVARVMGGSDEPWGVLALVTVAVLLTLRKVRHQPTTQSILFCTIIAVAYTLSYTVLPPLPRASLALMACAFSLSSIGYGRSLQPGLTALLLLSLPLIASLQFFGGYPLRLVMAYLSSQLLNLGGYDVVPRGTLLGFRGETIAVDAPCAGIKMLWSALYLNFTLAAWRDLNFLATWLTTSFALFAVFIGNLFRVTALFFVESGLLEAPDFTHQAIGLICFSGVALAVLNFHRTRRRFG